MPEWGEDTFNVDEAKEARSMERIVRRRRDADAMLNTGKDMA
jgi:hypothetical protein